MNLELVHDAQPTTTETDSTAAEVALLAALLTGHPAATEAFSVVASRDFWQTRNAAIWDACVLAWSRGHRIDPVTIELPALARPYLAEVMTSPGEPLLAAQYAAKVVEAAQRRRLLDASRKIAQLAEAPGEIDRLAEDARAAVDDAAATVTNADAGIDAAELVIESIEALEADEDTTAIATGWADLDEVTGGLRPGQLAIVGARPAVGKSVVAGNIAAAACKAGHGVHFASLEMTRREVMNRLLAAEARVNLTALTTRKLTDADWDRIGGKAGDIGGWPLRVDDQGSQSLAQIRARARSTSRRFPLGLVVVDYLQLMAPRDRRVSREQQVGENSEGLKALAKELGVPVLALAQVNRESARSNDKKPLMSDLRESGRIEADADHVWLLHREDLVDREATSGALEVHVAKNRNGPSGRTVELNFFGHYSTAASRTWRDKL